MKDDPGKSAVVPRRFWAAVSVAVGVTATLVSPLLLVLAGSCGSGLDDPITGVFLLPALPLICLVHALGLHSMIPYCLAVGVSYGTVCYVLGRLVLLLRGNSRRKSRP